MELILKTINNQHSVESQDNDQPDYDSVASDEDTDLEATASKANRQKVRWHIAHRKGEYVSSWNLSPCKIVLFVNHCEKCSGGKVGFTSWASKVNRFKIGDPVSLSWLLNHSPTSVVIYKTCEEGLMCFIPSVNVCQVTSLDHTLPNEAQSLSCEAAPCLLGERTAVSSTKWYMEARGRDVRGHPACWQGQVFGGTV